MKTLDCNPDAMARFSATGLDVNVKTVMVNSVRWLCPKCYHANAACPSALGSMFACEKCGTTARVVMSKASNPDMSYGAPTTHDSASIGTAPITRSHGSPAEIDSEMCPECAGRGTHQLEKLLRHPITVSCIRCRGSGSTATRQPQENACVSHAGTDAHK